MQHLSSRGRALRGRCQGASLVSSQRQSKPTLASSTQSFQQTTVIFETTEQPFYAYIAPTKSRSEKAVLEDILGPGKRGSYLLWVPPQWLTPSKTDNMQFF